MEHERLEQALRAAAAAYHRPPDTPRREMWLRIQAARAAAHTRHVQIAKPRPRVSPWVWSSGIAAALVIGLGLGRLSVRPAATRSSAGAAAQAEATNAAYRYAMVEHLNQTDAFLTLFRNPVRRREASPLTIATARQLLATNRLLLDSPAAAEQSTRFLLEDVELLLARIVQLSPETRREDRDLITESMDRSGILARLRLQKPIESLAERDPS